MSSKTRDVAEFQCAAAALSARRNLLVCAPGGDLICGMLEGQDHGSHGGAEELILDSQPGGGGEDGGWLVGALPD